MRERCRRFRNGFAGADVYYAGKAFLCKAMVRIIAEEGLSLDVCTGGELAVALAAGMPPERIGLHGNNKSHSELERAVDAGVGRIVVDSFDEIDRLTAIADENGHAAEGDGPRHRRCRGSHPRVHRHRPRGPEVRLLPVRRRGGGGRRQDRQGRRSSTSSACTRTSARRSSTRPASSCRARRLLQLHKQIKDRARHRTARDGPRRRVRHRLHHRRTTRPTRPTSARRCSAWSSGSATPFR